ncbi:MAG: methyltransferase domain-containing protein [Phycisphaerales bacterium]|nr:MAG: methyltransferase domain-containing protein [Phycisphaerales bacterium]
MASEADSRALQRFYRWNAPIYDLTRWTILHFRRAAVEAMRLSPGMKVLDLGCGTGLSFRLITRRIGHEGVLVGVDLSADMLRRAARRQTRNIHLICAEAGDLHLKPTFDAVLMAYSLTMIPKWESAIRHASKHVREGGTIVILDFGRPEGRFSMFRRAFDRYLALNHVRTDRDLKGLLQQNVNRVEVLRPVSSYATLLRGTR